jgi:hypothetical protein
MASLPDFPSFTIFLKAKRTYQYIPSNGGSG